MWSALFSTLVFGPRAESDPPELPPILVLGTSGELRQRQPGASTAIDAEQLRLQRPRCTEEALRSVPGVSIKPEGRSRHRREYRDPRAELCRLQNADSRGRGAGRAGFIRR